MLISKLPEGWKIPSMIGFVSQFAQIGPIALFFMKCMCCSCFSGPIAHRLSKRKVPDRFIIYGLFVIGITACVVMALFWDKTAIIGGKERSVTFFTCVFFLALLDCTCTIVFLTYCGSFKGNYITSLYIGEGISSLLPSLFALMQGIDDDKGDSTTSRPRFGVSAYFWLLLSTLVVSFLSLLVLDFWPRFQREKLVYKRKRNDNDDDEAVEERNDQMVMNSLMVDENRDDKEEAKRNRLDLGMLLGAITIVSFTLYGFIPGLSSYR
mgnify:CR=1 FL=1